MAMGLIQVLLVDDEAEFVSTLAERLQLRRFETEYALSGAEALDLLKKKMPDVLVLDLKMPGLDGMDVLRRTKQTAPELPVIILTGHGSDKDENEARRLGAFKYLKKPVDIDTLIRYIQRACQSEGPGFKPA